MTATSCLRSHRDKSLLQLTHGARRRFFANLQSPAFFARRRSVQIHVLGRISSLWFVKSLLVSPMPPSTISSTVIPGIVRVPDTNYPQHSAAFLCKSHYLPPFSFEHGRSKGAGEIDLEREIPRNPRAAPWRHLEPKRRNQAL